VSTNLIYEDDTIIATIVADTPRLSYLIDAENPDTILVVDNANLDTQLTPSVVVTQTLFDEGGPGPQGPRGYGVAYGGATGDVLTKIDNTDFNTQWTPFSYNYIQSTASTTWTIAHNLGRKPVVNTYTVGGTSLIGTVTNLSNNVLEISFSASVAGTARLV
jgi:hypothetical protein